MATIYTKPDGTQVYDFNGQTINAKTGQIYQPAAPTASAPNTQVAPSIFPTQSVSQGAVTQNSSTLPPLPDSLYQSARSGMANGTMTPQQAQQYLQSYLGTQYSGAVDTNKLYAAMVVNKGGAQYALNGDGSLKPMNANVQNSNTNITTGTTSTKTTTAQNASGLTPTGNASLDAALGSLGGIISQLGTNGAIPSTLQITPALIGKFLAMAHAAVDPQTQQLLSAESANINAAIKNAQTQYENTQAGTVQQYGSELADLQDSAGRSGVAFSGQRNLNESNLTATANRKLTSAASQSAYDIGSLLRAGGEDLGSTNASMLTTPTEKAPGTLSNIGGSRGSYAPSTLSLDFGYNPSTYTAGKIPSSQSTAVGNLQSNYLTQYSNLAATNSNGSKSINDLLGMITGVPAGQSLTL